MNCQLTITFKGVATSEISYVAGLCKTSSKAMPRAVELVLEEALNRKMHSQHSTIFSGSALTMDEEGQYQFSTEIDAVVMAELEDHFSTEEKDFDFETSLGFLIKDALEDRYNFDSESSIIVTQKNKLEPK